LICQALLESLAPHNGYENNACLPEDEESVDDGQRELEDTKDSAADNGAGVEPDSEKSDGEEVVEEDERTVEDTGEESNRTVSVAALEVGKASVLKST